jgi:DNA replication protein DnaC
MMDGYKNMSTAESGFNMSTSEEIELKTFHCLKHGYYTDRKSSISYLGKERKIYPACPKCEDEMNIKREEEEKKFQDAMKALAAKRQEERFLEMNIGKKFLCESFDTFDAYTPDLERYLNICKTFADDPQGRMLFMLGKHGNGKNHLAASILKKTGGYMYSVFEIELMLRECYAGKTGESEIYKRLCNTPVLVINEIGRHKIGEWETHFLSYIINKRYENLMPTVLITNTHLRENCPDKGCPDCLQNYLSSDVLSRVVEDGEIMIFNEKDYRYKKREMRGES